MRTVRTKVWGLEIDNTGVWIYEKTTRVTWMHQVLSENTDTDKNQHTRLK